MSLATLFERVVTALNRIASQMITWPRGDRIVEVTNSFQRIAGVPNVVGAIDGTFVPIKAPSEDPEVYVTRKCNYAITLQAICDADLKFIDVFAGYPGSVNDQRIFRNSDIYRNIVTNPNLYFPEGHFIIGDKAYPPLNWCVPPYIDRGLLTDAQRNFNNLISKTRQTIERSFALLFGRFRRLRYLDMNRSDLIPATVLGACVLHNICLNGVDNNLNNYEAEGIPFVNPENYEEVGNNFNNNVGGIQFHDQLCELLNNR